MRVRCGRLRGAHSRLRGTRSRHADSDPGGWRTEAGQPISHAADMKAILQATLAAILSGILVGALLKKKVAQAGGAASPP